MKNQKIEHLENQILILWNMWSQELDSKEKAINLLEKIDMLFQLFEKESSKESQNLIQEWSAKVSSEFISKVLSNSINKSVDQIASLLNYSKFSSQSLRQILSYVNLGNLIVDLLNTENLEKQSELLLVNIAKNFYQFEVNFENQNQNIFPNPKSEAFLRLGQIEKYITGNLDSAIPFFTLGALEGNDVCKRLLIWEWYSKEKYLEIVDLFERISPIDHTLDYFNSTLMIVSISYFKIGKISESDSLLDLITNFDQPTLSLLSSLSWFRFLEGNYENNSKFQNLVTKYGPMDEYQYYNFASNIILLELAKSKNYDQALNSWLKIPNPIKEVKMYMAAALNSLNRFEQSKYIIKEFSIIEKWLQIEIIDALEKGQNFALDWAKICRAVINYS